MVWSMPDAAITLMAVISSIPFVHVHAQLIPLPSPKPPGIKSIPAAELNEYLRRCGLTGRRQGRDTKKTEAEAVGNVEDIPLPIIEDRVMGGQEAGLNDYPSAVFLRYTDEKGRPNQCGGTLISRWHVITAGHCLMSFFWCAGCGAIN